MELEALLMALKASAPSRWRDSALSALESGQYSFEGNRDSSHKANAQELISTYRDRLEFIRKRRGDVTGIEELLEKLGKLSVNAKVRGSPFLGKNGSLYAFWDEQGTLIGCVITKTANSSDG